MRLAEVNKAAVATLAAAVLVSLTAAAAVVVVSMAAAAVVVVSMAAVAVVMVSMAAAAVAVVSMAAAAVAVASMSIAAAAADMMILQLTGGLRVHPNVYLCHSACSADVHEALARCQKLSVRCKPHSNTSRGLYCTATDKDVM